MKSLLKNFIVGRRAVRSPSSPRQGCASQLDAGCRCRRFRYRLEASQRGPRSHRQMQNHH